MKEYEEEAKKNEEWKKNVEKGVNATTGLFAQEEEDRELEGSWLNVFGGSSIFKQRRYWTSQRYATYPPSIPG